MHPNAQTANIKIYFPQSLSSLSLSITFILRQSVPYDEYHPLASGWHPHRLVI
jgi:hypothetical protein